jgi:hypothetical protein
MKFNLKWTHGLNDRDKKNLEEMLRNSPPTLKRLKEIVTKRVSEVDAVETKTTDYGSPSWAYLQAHRNGHKQALNEILELLSFLP